LQSKRKKNRKDNSW